ncbi:kinase suppressor of Ras 2-like [Cydia amplana]|uniref:kinase suppressor of Ras 2-like n=1 Tax=Cydia amplana TaxID=1869771 RepID=UPI002FE5B331
MDIDESEIRDAIEMVETLQSMIDVAAERLEGLRTQCSTSAGLTQQEIRTLEGKLLKHFAKQLKIKERFEEILPQLNDIPCLRQWLRVVGLSEQAIQQICLRVSTLDSLRDRSDSELRGWLVSVREEEWKRLCRAMNRLRAYTDALNRGEAEAEIQLYWDSWDRNRQEWERTRLEWERSQQWRGSPRARMRQRGSVPSDPDNTPRKATRTTRRAKVSDHRGRLEWERSQQWRGSPRARMRQRGSVPSDPDNTPRKATRTTRRAKVSDHRGRLEWERSQQWRGSPRARMRQRGSVPSDPDNTPRKATRTTRRAKVSDHRGRLEWERSQQWRGSPRARMRQRGSVPSDPDNTPRKATRTTRRAKVSDHRGRLEWERSQQWRGSPRARMRQRGSVPSDPDNTPRKGSAAPCPATRTTRRAKVSDHRGRLEWERSQQWRGSPRARMRQRGSVPSDPDNTPRKVGKSPRTPLNKRKENSHLPAPTNLTKSRSHESQLAGRPDEAGPDASDSSLAEAAPSHSEGVCSPPASPPSPPAPAPPAPDPPPHHADYRALDHAHGPARDGSLTGSLPYSVVGATPRSPRTPVGRCMAHDIAHRFAKTFNMIATCDYCDKQMLFGSGLKCKECKFKCHRDCESKVPPSCGLPVELVHAFRDKVSFKETPFGPSPLLHLLAAGSAGSPGASRGSLLGTMQRTHRHKERRQKHPGDDLSNSSSCNSSTPSSPALVAPSTPHHPPHVLQPAQPHKPQFHFPEVKPPVSSPNHVTPAPAPARIVDFSSEVEEIEPEEMAETNDVMQDSLDANNQNQPGPWPRQNSLSLKEWDIPYDELILLDVIGKGRFGTVYRGCWHGAVAVKLLHVQTLSDHAIPLDTFKHEVATFRKTRHENLVLFMGACMKPPRLAIVTSLCGGMTLHMHIHLRKDKFNPNKSLSIAQQVTQGMGYLHARGILHKDLRTKNIFVENGRAIITDFGLFSVTKLCFGNNARGDSLGIPPGWLCYLAPELMRALRPHTSLHLPFSKQTDVYAFGTVWYELLCLDFPFKGQPAEAIIWQVGKGVKQALGNMSSTKDVKDMLMSCWAYQPSSRPDFASLLASFEKLPRKRLARSPSHPVNMSRSAEAIF